MISCAGVGPNPANTGIRVMTKGNGALNFLCGCLKALKVVNTGYLGGPREHPGNKGWDRIEGAPLRWCVEFFYMELLLCLKHLWSSIYEAAPGFRKFRDFETPVAMELGEVFCRIRFLISPRDTDIGKIFNGSMFPLLKLSYAMVVLSVETNVLGTWKGKIVEDYINEGSLYIARR